MRAQIRFRPFNDSYMELQVRKDPRDLPFIKQFLCRLGLYNKWYTPELHYLGVNRPDHNPCERWSPILIPNTVREGRVSWEEKYRNMFPTWESIQEYFDIQYQMFMGELNEYIQHGKTKKR